jgi:hypothetical protein
VARGNGLSLGVKSREFPRQLNHSTRQAKGFVSADKSGVLSRMGGTKVKVGVGATIKVVVEANSVTGGEPRPLFSRILGRVPLRLSPESRHRDIDLKPQEERVRRVRVVARLRDKSKRGTMKLNFFPLTCRTCQCTVKVEVLQHT